MASRWHVRVGFVAVVLLLMLLLLHRTSRPPHPSRVSFDAPPPPPPANPVKANGKLDWEKVPHRYPVPFPRGLPSAPGATTPIPRIQARFPRETRAQGRVRARRLQAVLGNFTHAWRGYKEHAWLRDEVAPLSGTGQDPFGGWAATLVDSLDTLWIMGLKHEFDEAVKAVETIDFSTCAADEINVFETNIRYLGGFLAAYDLSGRAELLRKAIEIGSLLYKAFDTPNRMPITRWKFKSAAEGRPQVASDSMLIAEIGSLTLEFTRLSQVSGDPRYYDAVQRIMDVLEAQQDLTNLPGMWPVVVNAKTMEFNLNGGFTLGGMADSAYEYLPKQHLLLGGATQQYRNMYEKALIAMKRNIFFRPMVKNNSDLLFAGNVDNFVGSPVDMLMTVGEAQHLGCFAGGMVGIGARMFSREEDMATARKLMEGCLWAYENARGGIMPEILELIPCEDKDVCPFDEGKWIAEMNKTHHTADKESAEEKQKEIGLPHGVVRARDKRYILRPEAIESVFILYRLTGDRSLQDRAWAMFNSIIGSTITDIAHAALDDCTVPNPPKADKMESFWLAETLKYFFLIFSAPDVVSLDRYVLNTEAHPLKRP